MVDMAVSITREQRRDPVAMRRLIRAGHYPHPTSGLAPGYVQCNLAILPAEAADEFAAYCAANPRAMPVLARSAPGDPRLPTLGDDLDLRTDVGSYRVFRDGDTVGDVPDISDLWQDDFVAFSFEQALVAEGVDLRFRARGDGEAIYVSDIRTVKVGRFAAPLVVSMRPLRPADAIKAVTVTAKYPGVHGEPVHIALPEMIGIDLARPFDSLGRVRVMDDELPVFWACGVTPQLALSGARLPICITHTSAYMLLTDLKLEDLATLRG